MHIIMKPQHIIMKTHHMIMETHHITKHKTAMAFHCFGTRFDILYVAISREGVFLRVSHFPATRRNPRSLAAQGSGVWERGEGEGGEFITVINTCFIQFSLKISKVVKYQKFWVVGGWGGGWGGWRPHSWPNTAPPWIHQRRTCYSTQTL